MSSQGLHIPKRSADAADLTSPTGDSRPPTGVRRAALKPKVTIKVGEPVYDDLGGHRLTALRTDHSVRSGGNF